MTNRKFKDYHKNVLAHQVISKNFELLCTIVLVLNQEFPKVFYPQKCVDWIKMFAENCKIANELDEEDALEFKLEQWTKKYSIDNHKVRTFVRRRCSDFVPQNRTILAGNVKLALVQTAQNYGIGSKRMARLQDALIDERIADPRREIAKLGIDNFIEDDSLSKIDYRKFKYDNKPRVSLDEQIRGRAGLEAFKRWTEENVKREEK